MPLPPAPPVPAAKALPKRKVTLIVVHCSATPSGRRVDGTVPPAPMLATPTSIIDGWHGARGFVRQAEARNLYNWQLAHIGYHFVIDLDGTLWKGRHPREVGAHARGHNTSSIGICLVGGAERQARYSAEQWKTLRDLVVGLCIEYDLDASMHVLGHRDLSPDTNRSGQVEEQEWLKTCPGFDVRAWVRHQFEPVPFNVLPSRSDL